MTARKIIDSIVPARAFNTPPKVGMMIGTRSKKSVVLISHVAAVRHNGYPAAWHLYGMKIAVGDLPADAVITPYPRRGGQEKCEQQQRPSYPITTRHQQAKAGRERVVRQLKAARADAETAAPAIRISTGTAVTAEWVDPHDTNVRRRFPRKIIGHRSVDNLDALHDHDTINRKQLAAARRFRACYETAMGTSVVSKFETQPGRCGPGSGPTEAQYAALQEFRAAKAILGARLFVVAEAVVLKGEAIVSYAQRMKINRMAASEQVRCLCSLLQDHYETLDEQAAALKY